MAFFIDEHQLRKLDLQDGAETLHLFDIFDMGVGFRVVRSEGAFGFDATAPLSFIYFIDFFSFPE